MKMNKQVKCNCGKIAVWTYMPGVDNYYCDDCVSLGCSCNWYFTKSENDPKHVDEMPKGIENVDWKWIIRAANEDNSLITIEDGIYEYLDDEGRSEPCCEFFYDENGYEQLDENDNNDYEEY